ncbi:MAG: hypothetical protein COA90_04120 [Gammaproteobacteria bacterium]|nr:MAG: hypothetical protein COA90_04120 [Gammaproteobacteria bacterium]
MIVIFKNEAGTYSVRPAFIGFIENNLTRRVLCTLAFPVTIILTITINLLQAVIVSFFILLRSFYYPIVRIKPIWKTKIWERPRTKSDCKKTME